MIYYRNEMNNIHILLKWIKYDYNCNLTKIISFAFIIIVTNSI